MKFLTYIALNDGYAERVTAQDVDPAEMAGVIDRTIEPVRLRQQGWALNRKSGYYVRGEIGSKRSTLVLLDDTVPIAVVGVCTHSRASDGLWRWMHEHAVTHLPDMIGPPSAPWACLRYDVPETVLPDWIDWWAKTAAWALATRDAA